MLDILDDEDRLSKVVAIIVAVLVVFAAAARARMINEG